MNASKRKLVGAFVMIGFFIAYALIAMTLVQTPAIQTANGLVQGLSYALIGLLWIVPLMPLIRWMERPER